MPKFLSVKEMLAIGEIVVGSLSLYNFFLTDFFDEKLFDVSLFMHRCMCASLCFMCYFNALGTWFWFSNIRITKLLNRVHKILVYFLLNILLISTHFMFKPNYGPTPWQYFEDDIFFDEIERTKTSLIIVILIFILSVVIIVFNVRFILFRIKYLKKKNVPKKRKK